MTEALPLFDILSLLLAAVVVVSLLAEHKIGFIALDLDPDRVLRSVGIGAARAAVITINTGRMAERAITSIRHVAPDLPVIARARAQEWIESAPHPSSRKPSKPAFKWRDWFCDRPA